MMKMIKRSERTIKARHMIAGFKNFGGESKLIGEYSKWKELSDGSRLQVSYEIYSVSGVANSQTFYFMSDVLGNVASVATYDLGEVLEWLKNHGYKTTHDWYIQDYGMSEEVWQEWNA